MAKKKIDVLKQKQQELNTYVNAANGAISLVTTTISTLKTINESIDVKSREIEEYIAGLSATKAGLADAKSQNERIISNFNALLG